MRAIEFQSTISGGIIRMPEHYRSRQFRNARVIVLTNETKKDIHSVNFDTVPSDDMANIHFASEAVLAKDWLTKHEDNAWKGL